MLDVPVLGIAQAAMHAAALVAGSFSVVTSTSATVPHALAHDNSRSIVLGCAAMVRFTEPLSKEQGV